MDLYGCGLRVGELIDGGQDTSRGKGIPRVFWNNEKEIFAWILTKE
jgi:hypothetical protein